MKINQYDIYEIDLSDVINDDELSEDRIEGVILSPNVMNEHLKSVIMAPLSNCNSCDSTPTTFKIDKNKKIRIDQISSLSKKRLIKYIGKLPELQINKIKNILSEMLVK